MVRDFKPALMRPERFSSGCPGKLVSVQLHKERIGQRGVREFEPVSTWSFVPDALPPKLDWRAVKADLFDELNRATAALGRVNGIVPLAPNSKVLRRALWMREARLSSEIENIHTTALDMVLSGAGHEQYSNDAAREAWNAMAAVQHALESDLPFSSRLIREMHAKLLVGVRGEEKRPGEFRDGPVYIGGNDPSRARFVPPPAGTMPGQLVDCLSELERFVNRPDRWKDIPALVQVALAHYQFETIHPFRDGNGRIGRALILHHLCRIGELELPVVSVSGTLHRLRQEYVDGLFSVSADGDWVAWIRFFVDALAEQAVRTRILCERLIDGYRQSASKIHQASLPSRVLNLLDHLYDHPLITAKTAASILAVTDPTARRDIDTLQRLGILRPIEGVTYGRAWYAPAIVDVVQAADEDVVAS